MFVPQVSTHFLICLQAVLLKAIQRAMSNTVQPEMIFAGKTFLVYKEESMAIKAKVKLDGRQFGEALVSAAYVAEEVYLST